MDQNSGTLVLKECSGIFDNGIKEVYELKTPNHSIKVTKNHPFFSVQRSKTPSENKLVWKKLEELEVGDEIVLDTTSDYGDFRDDSYTSEELLNDTIEMDW